VNDGHQGSQAASAEPLAPRETARLTDFARACKAAARAVLLYPPGHPAIAVTLGRIVQLTSAAQLQEPLRISVLADGLLLDGRAPARPDAAIGELASLLHDHLIGELSIQPGADVEGWRNFLLLLGRAPDAVRAEGGIARLWTTMATRHIELREIDYTEVLREREGGEAAVWEQVIANCLQGDSFEDLTEEALRGLLEAAGDSGKLADLIAALDAKASESGRGIGARTAALMRLLQGIVEAAKQRDPEKLEPIMTNIAAAVGRLTPEMMVSLLAQQQAPGVGGGAAGDSPALVEDVVSRMSDDTIAGFVSRNALGDDTSIERVAQAFHALVRDSDQRERLLALAHDDAASSPLGSAEGFQEAWDRVAQKLMTSYSDKPFVSDEYARELSASRTHPIDVEQVNDDPPERRAAWLGSVATTELRRLDITLLLDLLRIEEDTERLQTVMKPTVELLHDLFLVGDFDAAEELLAALVRQTQPDVAADRRQAALIGIDVLVRGPMMRHIGAHLATIDEALFQRVKAMCLSVGEVLIKPLAETLSAEDRSRPRERLTAILIGFGSIGKREVERLKTSPNPAVRRTAIYLLREFGGADALPELTELLDDNEAQVQREAVRAILNVGTDHAYQVLEKALAGGTPQSREAIMQSLSGIRDERATPLFAYIVRHVDHRGQLGWIYHRAIEALGALKDPSAIPVLREALYRGEWWAPRRTAMLRAAAAAALARIGTPEATALLEEAAHEGPRSVRNAARAHLAGSRAVRSAAR
jgi:hypothetical protein